MNTGGAVICARCGSQCDRDVAVARGWRAGQCPRCPPEPTPGNLHPVTVALAWWPDWPEVANAARLVWTAACGCGWAAAAESERAAWVAAFEHQGVLAAWQGRSVVARPPQGAWPRHRARMRYEIEAARLPAVPLRTIMACADPTRDRHPCRGVIPPGAGPAELCACPCHDEPGDPDPCRHCGATIGPPGPLRHLVGTDTPEHRPRPARPLQLTSLLGTAETHLRPHLDGAAAVQDRRVPSDSQATQTGR